MIDLADIICLRDIEKGDYIGGTGYTIDDLIKFLNKFPDGLIFKNFDLNRVTDIEYDKDIEHITCSFEIQKITMKDKR